MTEHLGYYLTPILDVLQAHRFEWDVFGFILSILALYVTIKQRVELYDFSSLVPYHRWLMHKVGQVGLYFGMMGCILYFVKKILDVWIPEMHDEKVSTSSFVLTLFLISKILVGINTFTERK